jgi:hypothetical protein
MLMHIHFFKSLSGSSSAHVFFGLIGGTYSLQIGHVDAKEDSSSFGSSMRNMLGKIGLGVLADPVNIGSEFCSFSLYFAFEWVSNPTTFKYQTEVSFM